MAYTYGNLAVREAERQKQNPKPGHRPKPSPGRRTFKLSALEKLAYLGACFALAAVLGSLVLLTSQLYATNHEIYQTKQEMKQEDERNAELKAKLWTVKNPEKLSAEAVAEGYKPVQENQKPSSGDSEASHQTASR